jgi:hypothetical protein
MDQDWPVEHGLRQLATPDPDAAARRARVPAGRRLLDRAEAAARIAGELAVESFWLHRAVLSERAERLSRAAERAALAAHRAGRLWPPGA